MKRFWLVLLSLGLIVAFSTSAMAVDVKFSGSFYAAGMYLNKVSLSEATESQSTAFYFQRLRLKTEFVVSPGLSLITRADIMERAWGAARTAPGIVSDSLSAGTTAENENIAFDYLYVQYASPIGVFAAGYMADGAWGTVFADSEAPATKVTYMLPLGGLILIAQAVKVAENSTTAKNLSGRSDTDNDKYYLIGIYNWKGGEAGLLGVYGRYAASRPAALGAYMGEFYVLEPYAKVQLGPVKIQAEVDYAWGTYPEFDSGVGDVSVSNLMGWIDATATFGPVYFGGTAAYISGDDPATTDKNEGGLLLNGGNDWNPCLIMFNYERTYWAGALSGHPYSATGVTNTNSPMSNAWFFQGKIGGNPIAALDIRGSVSYARADQKPTGVLNNDYGYEVDVTATYKITNNLSYMLGAGYLFTGDYFKGASDANNIRNDFLVINKLTLTF